MSYVVSVKQSKAQLKKMLGNFPKLLTSSGEIGQAFKNHFAFHLFTRIHKAFRAKSSGGNDEFGDKWKALKKTTIAYRKEPGKRVISNSSDRGLLNEAQNARWKMLFRAYFIRLMVNTKVRRSEN
jgi:hypothetical protein